MKKQNSEIEYELTFLATQLPMEIKNAKPVNMIDIYLPQTSDHPKLRLRKKGDSYVITKKSPVSDGDASVQLETSISLTREEFEALATVSDKKVVKNRYNVEINGHKAEVDEFLENLTGLILIDFEFNSLDEKSAFVPPKHLVDVTQELFVAGGMLAGKSYCDLKKDIERVLKAKL